MECFIAPYTNRQGILTLHSWYLHWLSFFRTQYLSVRVIRVFFSQILWCRNLIEVVPASRELK